MMIYCYCLDGIDIVSCDMLDYGEESVSGKREGFAERAILI